MTTAGEQTRAAQHENNYFYSPGTQFRPPPPRVAFNDIWSPPRHDILSKWISDVDVHDSPVLPLLKDHFWQGDPYMDPVVEHFRSIGMAKGRAMLDRALDNGIDAVPEAPPELVELFRHLDSPPEWYDAELWERGRQLWNNTSMSARVAMGVQDAMGTFVGSEVSTATGITGRFVADLVRRNAETSRWFYQVTKPSSLQRYSAGFKETIRVRMMHSQVRLAIMDTWNAEDYAQHGNPISTAMTMIAGTTFGLIPILIDDRYGRAATWDQIEAVTHYWSYICYVFGVAPEIIPQNATEALAVMNYGVATAGGPTKWTLTMVSAAVDSLDQMTGFRGAAARAAVRPAMGVVAFFSGEPLVRALLRGTTYEQVKLEPWRTLTGLFVRAEVALRRFGDTLPGRERRRRRAARRGDTYERIAAAFARAQARKAGIATDYTQHDRPKVSGCPVLHG